MRKFSVFIFVLALAGCDDAQSAPNATPTVEAVGQFCLDNISEAQECMESGEIPEYCIVVAGYDSEVHFAWSAYYECVTNECTGKGFSDEEYQNCVRDELEARDPVAHECNNALSLCEMMAGASLYWAD